MVRPVESAPKANYGSFDGIESPKKESGAWEDRVMANPNSGILSKIFAVVSGFFNGRTPSWQ